MTDRLDQPLAISGAVPAAMPRGAALRSTAILLFGLVANLTPLLTFATTLHEIARDWGLSADQSGWIGGIYFAGYALAVPLLGSAADRLDGRLFYVLSCALGAAASLGFAVWAHGFWIAMLLRFLGGIAFAGVHMPGMKLLVDRVGEAQQARAAALYTSCYAIGGAVSLALAGVVDAAFGWRATFVAGAFGPLLAMAGIALLPPAPGGRPTVRRLLEFAPVLRNRGLMAYVVGFAGNTWEVFAVRVWFVAYLAWTIGLPGNHLSLPPLGVVAGLASLAGLPVSIAVAELAAKYGRQRAITGACAASVLVCLGLAATAGGPAPLVMGLLILVQITSFADVGALAGGAVLAADPARRGSALAIYALAGYATGFLGPVAVGLALDWFGGAGSVAGWRAAFVTIALGSTVAVCAVRCAPKPPP
ncbi:MAG TPA: MFS transporter [Stellaceae bacterium]|nr:MFS transporter [Stellaceae bacterium]